MRSERLRRLLGYSWAAVGSKLAWTAYNESDSIVLGRLAGDVTLGFYAMANWIALLPVEKIAAVVNQISAPVLPARGANRRLDGLPDLFRNHSSRGCRRPSPLNRQVDPDHPGLQLLSLYAAMRSLILLFPPVLMAGYQADWLFRYNLLLLIVLPAAFGIRAWWNGGVGVALAWALVYLLVAAWIANRGLQVLEMIWGALGWELRTAVASTIGMLAMAVVAHLLLSGQGTVGLMLAIFIAAFVYGFFFFFFFLFGGAVLGDVRLLLSILGVRFAAGPKPLPLLARSESNRGSRP